MIFITCGEIKKANIGIPHFSKAQFTPQKIYIRSIRDFFKDNIFLLIVKLEGG